MLTYEKLIAIGSLDTTAMVKKADALVTTMSQPQDSQAAIARTGTARFFADRTTKPSTPVVLAASPSVKSAMRKTPGVSFKMSDTQRTHC